MGGRNDSGIPMQVIRNDHSSVNVTTAAWVQLDSALNADTSMIEIFDSSGSVLQLAVGASGAEVAIPYYIVPGGAPTRLPFILPQGARLSVKAIDANATTGQLILNLMR